MGGVQVLEVEVVQFVESMVASSWQGSAKAYLPFDWYWTKHVPCPLYRSDDSIE